MDGGDGGSGGKGEGGGTPAASPTGPRLADHPAEVGIESQPTLGLDTADATATVVAFEDPSCTLCRRFEQKTFPALRSRLVGPGDPAFAFWGYPVVYPWGEPATQALEAAYTASEDAFWALKDQYYAEESAFDTDNVLSRTESFLANETDVDAAAVVEAARNGEYGAAVRADVEAAEAAQAGSRTPIFYLFRDGRFRTRISGPQGYDVFAAAMGF
jgi:protein-disulfide isomerase